MSESTPPSPRRRRGAVVITCSATLVLAIGATTLAIVFPRTTPSAPPTTRLQTVAVEQKVLVHTATARGTIGFAATDSVTGLRAGVVTSAPEVGTTLTPGSAAYRVNDVPITVFRGALPAWRTFEPNMSDGPDVRQLEQALRDAGHFRGTVDDRFTTVTEAGVKRWQRATGVEPTGVVALGDVLFLTTDRRVASSAVAAGDAVESGKTVMTLSGADRIVSGTVAATAQSGISEGAPVSITFPSGATVPGTVRSIGGAAGPRTAADAGAGSGSEPADKPSGIPLTVSFDDPAQAPDVADLAVRMTIETGREAEALVVPVSAVLATGQNGVGVQIPGKDGTTRIQEVELGANANGDVIVTKGLRAGDRVVVPS